MATKRIISCSAITYDQVGPTDVLLVGQTSGDKKITFPLNAKYVLGNRTIAGSSNTDIPTLGSTGTFTNKTYTLPMINSTASVTAASELINVLDGITATTALLNVLDGITATVTLLNYVDGVTSAIQPQLNGKMTQYSTTYPTPIAYGKIFTASATSYSLAATTVLTLLGLSTATYCLSNTYLITQLYQITSATEYVLVNAGLKITIEDNGSGKRISTISYTGITSGSVYSADISFKLGLRVDA